MSGTSLELISQLEGAGAIFRTGLQLNGEVSRDKMIALGRLIGSWHDSAQFSAGDYLVECDRRFGHEADTIAETLGISLEAAQQYRRVAEAIPFENRVEGVTWSHHRAVAHLTPDEQAYYLNEAARCGWVKRELEAVIRRDLGPQNQPEIPTPAESVCPSCGRPL
jgi:hypothetical protein